MFKLIKTDIRADKPLHTNVAEADGRFTVTVSGDGAELVAATAVYAFDFDKGDRVFINGYQSWTLSRERGIYDKNNAMRFCPKFMDKKYGFSKYGDGHFYKRSFRRGVHHGYTYGYIRRDGKLMFIGSLAERSGFTRIIFDCKAGTVTLEKDCIGRRVTGEYTVFDIMLACGGDEVFDSWFEALGIVPRPAQKLTGYTSWYNYYQNISEDIITNDLSALSGLKPAPDIFQVDDGFETAVGDWLSIDKAKFPGGLEPIAKAITAQGLTAGIWLAPFVCEKKSQLFCDHPDWLLTDGAGPVYGGCNWSGMYALDFYNADVREYIKACIDHYKALGFTLFKLDFLYAACMLPKADKTRAEIMFEAMDFLREVCGTSAILGCGVPLAPAFGCVEYCRIGPDMSLSWDDKPIMRLFHAERPSTKNTMLNSIYRRQLSGRAFYNDPDVFLLRDYNTSLTDVQKRALATVNCLFGGVLFTSDDSGRYGDEQRRLYADVIALKDATDITVSETADVICIDYTLADRRESFSYKING